MKLATRYNLWIYSTHNHMYMCTHKNISRWRKVVPIVSMCWMCQAKLWECKMWKFGRKNALQDSNPNLPTEVRACQLHCYTHSCAILVGWHAGSDSASKVRNVKNNSSVTCNENSFTLIITTWIIHAGKFSWFTVYRILIAQNYLDISAF